MHPPTSHPLVQAHGIFRTFAGSRGAPPVQAVSGVSLDIHRGEALGLVGESGSGKSTVGRLLLGLLPTTAGTVRFDGQDLGVAPTAVLRRMRRRMQLVFQDPFASLDPRRRIGDQIADGLRIHRLVPAGALSTRVEALLEAVGLSTDGAQRFPHEFSGGQRQRIGIARALATEPEFLVADEPVSALDVSVQAQVLALLAQLRSARGLTMLFISHDLPAVGHLCDRIAVLYLGRVVEIGPTASVFQRPGHPYTAALLSAAPAMGRRTRRRILLLGDPPSPASPPPGCVFHTRCPYALDRCAQVVPQLTAMQTPGHDKACIRDDIDWNQEPLNT